jgi:hypothetical protein
MTAGSAHTDFHINLQYFSKEKIKFPATFVVISITVALQSCASLFSDSYHERDTKMCRQTYIISAPSPGTPTTSRPNPCL